MSEWVPVCRVGDVPRERGVAALVEGQPIAIVATHDGNIHAISNRDPFSGASVMARGIVGSRGSLPVISSPMYKQVFDLRTGQCLDDAAVRVPVHEVRVDGDTVLVRLEESCPPHHSQVSGSA